MFDKVIFGMNRREVQAILGEPSAVGGISRKHRHPLVFKYDQVEFHFSCGWDGVLATLYQESEDGQEVRLVVRGF